MQFLELSWLPWFQFGLWIERGRRRLKQLGSGGLDEGTKYVVEWEINVGHGPDSDPYQPKSSLRRGAPSKGFPEKIKTMSELFMNASLYWHLRYPHESHTGRPGGSARNLVTL